MLVLELGLSAAAPVQSVMDTYIFSHQYVVLSNMWVCILYVDYHSVVYNHA